MNGVGRPDPESHISTNWRDEYNANTARARVDYMLNQLDDYMQKGSFQKGEAVNIDIVGFSRGAAMARDFSNKIAQRLQDHVYDGSNACVKIRFMGLWDTVAQFGVGGNENDQWQLSVPAEAKNVFQAVALNEYRYAFPGESIMGGAVGGARVERGFVGSHADIGGGYAEGDLSDIPLAWIYKQAIDLGIKMKALQQSDVVVTNPIMHNKELTDSNPLGLTRKWRIRASDGVIMSDPSQKEAAIGGMSYAQTRSFINYFPDTIVYSPFDGTRTVVSGAKLDAYGKGTIVGRVDMEKYSKWLAKNYGISVPFSP